MAAASRGRALDCDVLLKRLERQCKKLDDPEKLEFLTNEPATYELFRFLQKLTKKRLVKRIPYDETHETEDEEVATSFEGWADEVMWVDEEDPVQKDPIQVGPLSYLYDKAEDVKHALGRLREYRCFTGEM